MKNRTRRYLIAVSVLPLLLLSIITLFWVNRQGIRWAEESLEGYLNTAIHLTELSTQPDKYVKNLSEGLPSHVRITLLDENGTVLGDTHADYATMPSHSDRQEFLQAQKNGRGTSVRYSSTTGQQTVYLAKPWQDNYILRFSMPVSAARDFLYSFLPVLIIGFLVLGVFISMLVDRFARRIAVPYEQMLVYIEDTLQSGYQVKPELSSHEEMQPIIHYFHYLLEQISSHIAQVSAKSTEIANITSAMEEGLVLLDKDWNILLMNRQACKFLQVPTEGWQTKITYLYRSEEFANVLENTVATGIRGIADIPQGEKILRFYVNPVPEGGVVLLISDVSELVHLERIRSEFAANVSHELKTPLTSISGFAELLQTGMVSEPQKVMEYSGKILTESRRLVTLIDDILNLSALENAVYEQADPVDLRSVFRYTQEILAPQIEEKQIRFSLEGSLWVCASRDHLYELAFNLCENGIKYNKQGGSLTIHLLPYGFTVTDTGIGIAPEDQLRIFERFYRADKARSRKTGGTGLGLSIAKHIMALYGGSIRVESGEWGSRFCVTFPPDLIGGIGGAGQHEVADEVQEL